MRAKRSRTTLVLLVLSCTLTLGLSACSDDDTPDVDAGTKLDGKVKVEAGMDGGVDQAVKKEAGADQAVKQDGAPDQAVKQDGAPDQAVKQDSAPDQAVTPDQTVVTPDQTVTVDQSTVTPDGPAPGPEKVIYSANSSSSKFTLNEVLTDGTGQKTVAGVLPNFSLEAVNVAGSASLTYYPTDLGRTNMTARSNIDGEYYLHMPGSLGKLARFYESGTGAVGYAVVRPGGKVELVAQTLSGGSSGFDYYLAVSADGKLGAAVQEGKKVVLLRLDGTTWPGGSSTMKDITPSGATISSIYDDSLALLQNNLYFVVSTSSGRELYSAPVDGSAAATKVTLPTVSGSAASTLDYTPAINDKRTHVAWLVGGSSSSIEDVVVIKDGGTPVNVSKKGLNLYGNSTGFFDANSPRLALSSAGTYVVWGSTSSSSNGTDKYQAWVAKTDGSGTPTVLSSSTNFVRGSSGDVDTYGPYFWADDDNLLFGAGTSTTNQDLFHYKASTGALANLSKTGTKTAAPWDGGNWEFDGGWVSPNGKFFYAVASDSSGTNTTADIFSVDLTTFAGQAISSGLYIDSESNIDADMETVAGSQYVWFVAYKASASAKIEDVYVFDQNAGTPSSLKNLTNHTGTSAVSLAGLLASPDGKYASYIMGSGSSAQLYVVPTAGGTPTAITATAGYIGEAYVWASDSQAVIYGYGSSSSAKDLYIGKVSGGTPKKLHGAASYLYVMSSGK